MASQVDICNYALAKIGSTPIADLMEDSKEARSCLTIYALVRDEVLQVRPWPSCTARGGLQPLSDAPSFEFSTGSCPASATA